MQRVEPLYRFLSFTYKPRLSSRAHNGQLWLFLSVRLLGLCTSGRTLIATCVPGPCSVLLVLAFGRFMSIHGYRGGLGDQAKPGSRPAEKDRQDETTRRLSVHFESHLLQQAGQSATGTPSHAASPVTLESVDWFQTNSGRRLRALLKRRRRLAGPKDPYPDQTSFSAAVSP
jgi:hypothetical protein